MPRRNSSQSRRFLFPIHRAVGLAAWTMAAAAAPLAMPAPAAAEQERAPDVDNSKYSFVGQLNTNAMVFSGPGTNFYPTQKLEKGAQVVVVGVKNNWLKIQPPEGSFSYVSKAFVQVYGDGKKGKVTSALIVKAGSQLQSLKWAVQSKLEPKDDVTVIAEEDEYFKIKPPATAYLYILKDTVSPVAPVDATAGTARPNVTPPSTPTDLATDPPHTTETPTRPTGVAGGVTPPTTRGSDAVVSAVSSTQPSVADALTRLQKLETDFSEASKLPLTDQPIHEMLEGYESLASTPGIGDTAKRISDVRIATLKVRSEASEQFKEVQKQQAAYKERATVVGGERQDIVQRIKETEVKMYVAVGTLRPSSLQISKTTLYRLTDPATGRTVIYVWGTDPAVGSKVNQFVGVKGDLQTDARLNLKVINPTVTELVDPAKLNTMVTADIVPPSLLPKSPTASTAAPAPE